MEKKCLRMLTESAMLSLKGDWHGTNSKRGFAEGNPQGEISSEETDVRDWFFPGVAGKSAIKRGMLDNRQGFPGTEGTLQDWFKFIQPRLQKLSDIFNEEGCIAFKGSHLQGIEADAGGVIYTGERTSPVNAAVQRVF